MIAVHEQFRGWYKDRTKRKTVVAPNAPDALLWLTAEIGELTDSYMRTFRRQYRRNTPGEGCIEDITKELCDVVCMTMAVATALGIDLDAALERFLAEERA